MAVFDLEDRMFAFASNVRDFLTELPQTSSTKIYSDQLLRSSSSVGANYIEANDAIGKKDFLVKIKTARREAKETRYWLRLLKIQNNIVLEDRRNELADEAMQLICILSAIAKKVDPSAIKEVPQ